MKIAVVGYMGWYGSMGEQVADGFEMNGHQVDRIDRKDIIVFTDLYDLMIFIDCSEDFSSHIPKCKKTIKACWLMDTHMPGGIERSLNIAKKCDIVFSSNYENGVKLLEKFGIKSYLMPITYNDRLTRIGGWDKMDIDIAMIGNKNSPEREQLFELLQKNYRCFVGRAETEKEFVSAMNSCTIVVNQPTEPWDIILNNRFFEALGFGKQLLQKTLKTTLIEKLSFKDKVNFKYWSSFDELRKYIDIILNGKAKVLNSGPIEKYSISNQCAKIESIILDSFYDKL